MSTPNNPWFSNRFQIIQTVAAVAAVGVVITLNINKVGSPRIWLLSLLTAPLVIAGSIYAVKRHRRKARVKHLMEVYDRLLKASRQYRSMMRRWPTSEALTNPFITGWRPSIGQTQIDSDHQSVMDWEAE